MEPFRCDTWRAATPVSDLDGGLDGGWAESLRQAAPLPTHLCRDVVVITTHLDEEVSAAGGLIAHLADHSADVEVLAVTDGDGTGRGAPGATQARELSRRRGRIRATFNRLGVAEPRLRRLRLESGKVADAEPDLIAAFSELVGYDCYPGLWCLAPWQHDGHPDHNAVGRAAEMVCRTYNLRLVRYLCTTWTWAEPQDLPWRHVRQFVMPDDVHARKNRAVHRPATVCPEVPVADREYFLV
jgi:LmbE family N-acetylglucosaminyl deacetylase